MPLMTLQRFDSLERFQDFIAEVARAAALPVFQRADDGGLLVRRTLWIFVGRAVKLEARAEI